MILLVVGRRCYGFSKHHKTRSCEICRQAGRPGHGWETEWSHQFCFGKKRFDVGKPHRTRWYGRTDAELCEVIAA